MESENRTQRIRGVSSAVQQAAAELRREMTPAEKRLWEELRGKKLNGLRFRAQHPVGQFILDFYCPACKLVIELDGSSHEGNREQDAARTAHLAAYNYQIVRFTNDQIENNLMSVLNQIHTAAQEQAQEAL